MIGSMNKDIQKFIKLEMTVGILLLSIKFAESDLGNVVLQKISIENAYAMEQPKTNLNSILNKVSDFLEQKKDNENEIEISVHEIKQVENKEEMTVANECSKYIYKYCQIYNGNYNEIYQKFNQLTNNGTDPKFLETNNVPGTEFLRQERSYPTLELGMFCFVRAITQKPKLFQMDQESVFEEHNYDDSMYSVEDIYIDCCSIFPHVEPEFALAIAYQETECFTSNAFLNYNNPAGYKPNGVLARFDNRTEGILECLSNYEFRYFIDSKLDPNGVDIISQFANKHTPIEDTQDQNNLNVHWIPNVTYFYNQLSQDIYSIQKETNHQK